MDDDATSRQDPQAGGSQSCCAGRWAVSVRDRVWATERRPPVLCCVWEEAPEKPTPCKPSGDSEQS